MSEAEHSATIGAALAASAARRDSALVFHHADGPRRVGADELLDLALARSARLLAMGFEPGDRIGLIGPTAVDFAAWAYATWLAGAVLVLLPSPIRVRDPEALRDQTASLATGLGCRAVVAHPRFLPYVPGTLGVDWTDGGSSPGGAAQVEVTAEDAAVVLCTSGSTATPKGIELTHRMVIGRDVGSSMVNQQRRQTTGFLSFLPLAQPGGFVSMLSVLKRGTEVHLLPPERFARDPGEWLRLAAPTGATFLGAASSAWAAALRAVERRPQGVDLSGVERATFSMEMVDPEVVERLVDVGGRFGLRPGVIGAVYGLSEGGATATRFGDRIRIDEVDLLALVSEGRADPAGGGPVKRVASCGSPVWGLEMRIVGPDGDQPERHVGEVQFRGPQVMERYVGPGTEDALVDGWLRTGDLGYVADGELFVTGHVKELIVHLGRKYHPEDIERAAARAAGAPSGSAVAFAPGGSDEGSVVVAVEVAGARDPALEDRIRAAVTNGVGVVPSAVVLVPPGTIPKGPGGKVQRLAARDLLGVAGTKR